MVGIDTIELHVMELGDQLWRDLRAMGLPMLTPEARPRRAGNIAFATDRSYELEARLRAAGIIAWAGDGRLRLSVHAYNDEADVRRAIDGVRGIVR
jgi:selenocysteine lyase/cysteine desulfurase